MLRTLGLVFILINIVYCVLYDRYTGNKLSESQVADYAARNLTALCAIDVKECTPHEGSRVDGTCNNLQRPTRGSAVGPFQRLLPPDYAKNVGPRVAKDGSELPLARKVRTTLHSTGRVVSRHFNMAALHFFGFIAADVAGLNGILDYTRIRTYCCRPEGQTDPRCFPIRVPDDDPYLRHTDIRCLNFTRAETFQDRGCTPRTLPPEQLNAETTVLDLSVVYGFDNATLASVRDDKDGLLKMETRNERYLPLADAGNGICFQNRPNETVCYRFGIAAIGNFDLRLATVTIFFMREHNRLAKELAKLNPCWSHDRLFKVARQINIATASNMLFYELLPLVLGYKNMVKYGLIYDRVQFVKKYDEDTDPTIYTEFDIGLRYFHTFIDGRIRKYNERYRETYPLSISDTLFRLAVIEEDKNFEEINRGTFYQKSGAFDDIQDPDIVEKFYGEIHRANDLVAIDIQRGRDLGVRGYNEYRKLCGLPKAVKFDDFLDVMDVSKVDALKSLYKDVDDVDMYAGIISENFIPEGFVGPTLFCLMHKQLEVFRYSDRFWFERGDQFHSFTLPQLNEIRKTNMARFACDNVDEIKFVQPQAFLNIGKGNEPVPCEHIPGADLRKWKDPSCHKDTTLFNFYDNPFPKRDIV